MATKKGYGILFGALAIFGGALWIGASNTATATKSLSYSLGKIRIKKRSNWFDYLALGLPLMVELKVVNPTTQPLKFQELAISLFMDTHHLSDVNISEMVVIAPNDTTLIQTSVNIGLVTAKDNIKTLFQTIIKGKTDAKVLAKGHIQIEGVRYPIEQQIPLVEE